MSDKIFTLEDYLTRYHSGQWFTYSDVKNKSYETLICKNDETRWSDVVKPTKKQCEDGVKALQTEWDALAWKRSREENYPSIADLVVALYDTDDKSAIEAKRASIKAKYPKPE